jgi:DNA-binding response OmpR family regulator
MEQVMNNLLSNAFKHTNKGGSIEVQLSHPVKKTKGSDHVEIKVVNTGIGIPADHIEHIFDRFYQVEESYAGVNEGTGIGLALCKELVELHHGIIQVQSLAGETTTFTITLPMGKDHLKEFELIEDINEGAFSDKLPETDGMGFKVKQRGTEVENNTAGSENTSELPVMLIVEDNSDMRVYIRRFFEGDFHIVEASDGTEGFEEARDVIPDIIISDVMMPNMDGYAFCKKIKSDELCSHIPIILLTARASKESRIEGLETGADDFITKPFDGDELIVRVRNLVEHRRRLSDSIKKSLELAGSYHLFGIKDTAVSSIDEQFLERAVKIVKQFLSDPEFKIDQFCNELAMSRTQMYRKLKALTGQSANEFIRTIRLKEAAIMLENKVGTIAEISYDVGFTSPSYFTECFSKQYGKTPSEYINS